MIKSILRILKVIILITTLIIAIISILYILDVFSGKLVKELIIKMIKIMGIIAGTSFVAIFLADNRENK